jgi:hypothetical protein
VWTWELLWVRGGSLVIWLKPQYLWGGVGQWGQLLLAVDSCLPSRYLIGGLGSSTMCSWCLQSFLAGVRLYSRKV